MLKLITSMSEIIVSMLSVSLSNVIFWRSDIWISEGSFFNIKV